MKYRLECKRVNMKVFEEKTREFLFETTKKFKIGDLIEHNKKVFYVVHVVPNMSALVNTIEISQYCDETLHEEEITCPVCGYIDHSSYEMEDDYDDEYVCPYCGSTLAVERVISCSYYTTVKNKNLTPVNIDEE